MRSNLDPKREFRVHGLSPCLFMKRLWQPYMQTIHQMGFYTEYLDINLRMKFVTFDMYGMNMHFVTTLFQILEHKRFMAKICVSEADLRHPRGVLILFCTKMRII